MGNLVRTKSEAETFERARRIKDVMNADVLAVQEVEHIDILKQFNREHRRGQVLCFPGCERIQCLEVQNYPTWA